VWNGGNGETRRLNGKFDRADEAQEALEIAELQEMQEMHSCLF
jgi:hypothetical protein